MNKNRCFIVTHCYISHRDCSRSHLCQVLSYKNPWVWYSHNIPPTIKMLNLNMTQRGTQATHLGVMIGRCSLNSQHRRLDCHPANLKNHTNQRRKRKTWTREDNQLSLHSYFMSNPSQRGYSKRMIDIWQKYACFQTYQPSQYNNKERLFFYLEIK